jgi:type IV pilus assembly protein PilB
MNARDDSPIAFTLEHIREARVAAGTERRIVEVLEERSKLSPEAFIMALATTLGYPALSMSHLHALEAAYDVLPFALADDRGCVVFRERGGRLLLAIGDPFDSDLLEWAQARIVAEFTVCLVHHADLAAYLARYEDTVRAMDSILPDAARVAGEGVVVEDLSFKTIREDSSPVVKLVHSTLWDAFKAEASDIHIESNAGGLVIKYRVDGVLTQAGAVAGTDVAEQVISRIKVMSELDIAERRVPQDGRFRVRYKGRLIDFRVSIMPTVHGENAVLRVLDKESMSEKFTKLSLDVVGFAEKDLTRFRRYIKEPYGMVLVTGPTGSGKTTTLYAALNEIKSEEDKIITIEDPVEYQIRGITQIPVNEKKGLTFARGLRSILRHDPDKILVGEIRDAETAQIAINSALTGHLVFTTVHANNVVDVLGRFLNMGVEPYNFVSALNCILAQRLVRTVCEFCVRDVTYTDDELLASGLDPAEWHGFKFKEGPGCMECAGTGFRGRSAIHELLELDDEIREMLLAKKPGSEIRKKAKEKGMAFLRDSALDRVRQGVTTLKEINKVTFIEAGR